MWTYKLGKISTPTLILIRVEFTLYKGEQEITTESLDFTPEELSGKDRTDVVDSKINERLKKYIYIDQIAEDLKSSLDTEQKAVESVEIIEKSAELNIDGKLSK